MRPPPHPAGTPHLGLCPLPPSLTPLSRQLPHAPESPVAVLSPQEKRAINLTWAKPFDGNSPLLRYVVEVSENSKGLLPPLRHRWHWEKSPASPRHRGRCGELGDLSAGDPSVLQARSPPCRPLFPQTHPGPCCWPAWTPR